MKRESPTLNIVNVELKINRKYQNAGKNKISKGEE